MTEVGTTCVDCGTPKERTLAARAYCNPCAERIIDGIRARHVPEPGEPFGKPLRRRDDHMPGYYDLECARCGATWTGPPSESCAYCQHRELRTIEHQREIVLQPPDNPVGLDAWIDRLAHAIDAGIIDRSEADRAVSAAERKATS